MTTKKLTSEINNSVLTEDSDCPHESTIDDCGRCICTDCGEEVKGLKQSEWKNIDKSKYIQDISRIHIRKTDDISIHNDVANMMIPDEVIQLANTLYEKITCGSIFRGSKRKLRVYGCVYQAYKQLKINMSTDRLVNIFNLNKKIASEGYKFINIAFPTSISNDNQTYPISNITDVMNKFSASKENVQDVLKLYDNIHNKSSVLNRARPQSVITGLVFYWLSNVKQANISIREFANIVDISYLTILNITKEIEIIFEKQKINKLLNGMTLSTEQTADLYNLVAIIKKSPLNKHISMQTNSHEKIVKYWMGKFHNPSNPTVSNTPLDIEIDKYLLKKRTTKA
jgi:transcription initiation factor TFIIIB Brf1 subunit/transcription initiation factor TFIIB